MEQRRHPGFLTRYAAHARISKEAARKQLKRLGIDYMQEFDFADADRRRAAARSADRMPFAKPIPGHEPQVHAQDDDEDDNDGATFIFSENQAKREHYKAELVRLEFDERIGKLTRTDLIEQEAFRIGRQVRDAMLNIPDRLAGVLAAETDQRNIHNILTKEIRQALEALTVPERGPAPSEA